MVVLVSTMQILSLIKILVWLIFGDMLDTETVSGKEEKKRNKKKTDEYKITHLAILCS